MVFLVMIGDSDISRWPVPLYPDMSSVQQQTSGGNIHDDDPSIINVGKDGALLQNMINQIEEAMDQILLLRSIAQPFLYQMLE